jgi:hypothetical protein
VRECTRSSSHQTVTLACIARSFPGPQVGQRTRNSWRRYQPGRLAIFASADRTHPAAAGNRPPPRHVDPTLTSGYAVNTVQGLQGDESAEGYLMTTACLKHYAAYSEETNRNSFSAVVNAQDMTDTVSAAV